MFPADVVPSQTHMALPSVAHVSSWKMTSPQRGFNTPYAIFHGADLRRL